MRHALIAAALLFAPAAASAHEVKAGAIAVVHPIMRASIGAAPNTAAYLTLRNTGAQPDKLLSASCACARKVEAHVMAMANGAMTMRAAPGMIIPAKGEVAFKPNAAHLMVFGLKTPAEAGTTISMTLTFERAGKVTVPVFVTANVDAEIAKHAGHAAEPAHHH